MRPETFDTLTREMAQCVSRRAAIGRLACGFVVPFALGLLGLSRPAKAEKVAAAAAKIPCDPRPARLRLAACEKRLGECYDDCSFIYPNKNQRLAWAECKVECDSDAHECRKEARRSTCGPGNECCGGFCIPECDNCSS